MLPFWRSVSVCLSVDTRVLYCVSPVTLYAGETENDRIDRIDTSAQNLQSSMIIGRCMVYAQYNPILSKETYFNTVPYIVHLPGAQGADY